MFKLKQLSLSVATIATTISVSVVCATTAQALNIVSGSVSGVWERDFDGTGGLNIGDSFTAEYTYDSDSIIESVYSSSGYDNHLSRTAPLLSLLLSGSFRHTFDFSYPMGGGNISWRSFQSPSPEYGQYGFEDVTISGFDSLTSVYHNNFIASKTSGIGYSDQPFSNSYAQASSYDYSTITYLVSAEAYSNVNFSGATPAPVAVPTPALLPGLIGLCMAALRKRKQNQAQEAAETAQV